MKLAVIPARGGSKRIPRKNVKSFCGKPMIGWPIGAAIESGCFDRVVVSTDDEEIAEIARRLGAETPFMRPPELSDDFTLTVPVIRHAIERLVEQGHPPMHVCCIYATAPFIAAADIRRGFDVLIESESDFAFSVTNYASPIQRAFRITAQGRVEMLHPEFFGCRSQDLQPAYHDAAQFYWGRAAAWLQNDVIFGPRSAAVQLSRYRVQDIDTAEDWRTAEYLFRAIALMSGGESTAERGLLE